MFLFLLYTSLPFSLCLFVCFILYYFPFLLYYLVFIIPHILFIFNRLKYKYFVIFNFLPFCMLYLIVYTLITPTFLFSHFPSTFSIIFSFCLHHVSFIIISLTLDLFQVFFKLFLKPFSFSLNVYSVLSLNPIL